MRQFLGMRRPTSDGGQRRPLRMVATLVALGIAVGLIGSGALAQRGTRGCNNSSGGGGYAAAAGYGTPIGIPACPAPKQGKTVNIAPRSGTIRFRQPGKSKFVVLHSGDQIPVGSVIDARKGVVVLEAAAPAHGAQTTLPGRQAGDFSLGMFRVRQSRTGSPLTTLGMTQRLRCTSGASAT